MFASSGGTTIAQSPTHAVATCQNLLQDVDATLAPLMNNGATGRE